MLVMVKPELDKSMQSLIQTCTRMLRIWRRRKTLVQLFQQVLEGIFEN